METRLFRNPETFCRTVFDRSFVPERTLFGRSFLPEGTFAVRRTHERTSAQRRRVDLQSATLWSQVATCCEVLLGKEDLLKFTPQHIILYYVPDSVPGIEIQPLEMHTGNGSWFAEHTCYRSAFARSFVPTFSCASAAGRHRDPSADERTDWPTSTGKKFRRRF